MAGILAGMAYLVVQEGTSVLESPLTILAFVGMVVTTITCMVMVSSVRRQLNKQAAQNEHNQSAILQLLDELADLADGDLTVRASVTENFTGAIADSINFAAQRSSALTKAAPHNDVPSIHQR